MKALILCLAIAGGWGIDSPGPQETAQWAIEQPRFPRVIVFTEVDNPSGKALLVKLRAENGPFKALVFAGWKIGPGDRAHLQVVTVENHPRLAEKYLASFSCWATAADPELPTIVGVTAEGVQRKFTSGCGQPLDVWTFGWLASGTDKRPKAWKPEKITAPNTGSYPLRGGWWYINRNFSAPRSQVLRHLRSVHVNKWWQKWNLEGWTRAELHSLHADDHEGRVVQKKSQVNNTARPDPVRISGGCRPKARQSLLRRRRWRRT